MSRDGKVRYPVAVNLLALLLHSEHFATKARIKAFPHQPTSLARGYLMAAARTFPLNRNKTVKDLYNNVGHRTHPLFRRFSSAVA